MPDTLLTIRTSVLGFMRGDLALATDVPLVNEAINDALSSIWNKMLLTQYERLFGLTGGGQPYSFSAPAGAQRVQLVSINDPMVPPVVGTVAGGALAARNYLVAFSYVTESGTETLASLTAPIVVPANSLATVTAPAYQAGFPIYGYNVYATGPSDLAQNLVLQNQNPIQMGVNYTEPLTGFQDYGTQVPGPPAYVFDQIPPTVNSTGDNIAWVEHLEIQTSDTLLRAWNQVGLDSEVMRRMARTLSTASEYQHYVWDLIGNNVIEIRPPLGLSFTPRYWPVVRPRRIAYDQGEIPYVYINGVREFIVSKAVADLKLTLEEYIAAGQWGTKADKAALQVQLSLLAENNRKDQRIVPHLW